MKKFLAVLLAVAILGVAGAAFAGEEPQLLINKAKFAEVAKKLVTSLDVALLPDGVNGKALPQASIDMIVEASAAQGTVVAVVMPTLSFDKQLPSFLIKLSLDKAYAGKLLKTVVTSKDKPLAGVASFDKVVGEKGETTLVVDAEAGVEYSIAGTLDSMDVKDIAAFSGAFTSGDIATVGALSTKISQDIFDKITKLVSVDLLLTTSNLGESIDVTTIPASLSKDKDAVLGLAELKNLSKDASYLFQVLSFDLLDSKLTKSADVKTLALDLDGKGSGYVKLAAKADAHFFDEKGTEVTKTSIPAKNGYVVFKATSSDAFPVLTVDKKSAGGDDDDDDDDDDDKKYSSKGSGGCNGGFAGIAVLALGLAALRRKAR